MSENKGGGVGRGEGRRGVFDVVSGIRAFSGIRLESDDYFNPSSAIADVSTRRRPARRRRRLFVVAARVRCTAALAFFVRSSRRAVRGSAARGVVATPGESRASFALARRADRSGVRARVPRARSSAGFRRRPRVGMGRARETARRRDARRARGPAPALRVDAPRRGRVRARARRRVRVRVHVRHRHQHRHRHRVLRVPESRAALPRRARARGAPPTRPPRCRPPRASPRDRRRDPGRPAVAPALALALVPVRGRRARGDRPAGVQRPGGRGRGRDRGDDRVPAGRPQDEAAGLHPRGGDRERVRLHDAVPGEHREDRGHRRALPRPHADDRRPASELGGVLHRLREPQARDGGGSEGGSATRLLRRRVRRASRRLGASSHPDASSFPGGRGSPPPTQKPSLGPLQHMAAAAAPARRRCW